MQIFIQSVAKIPRISLSDPAPLNILHSTKAKPRTPKYKEASYITGNYQRAPKGHTHLPWKIDWHDAKRRPARSHCSKRTGWRLANWSELSRPRRHQVCHRTIHVASVLRWYTWRHTPCCTSVYIALHVCILYSACTWRGPIRPKQRSCIEQWRVWVMWSMIMKTALELSPLPV